MKFLMTVLTIRFIAEVIMNKRKNNRNHNEGEKNEIIRHPAEYGLR